MVENLDPVPSDDFNTVKDLGIARVFVIRTLALGLTLLMSEAAIAGPCGRALSSGRSTEFTFRPVGEIARTENLPRPELGETVGPEGPSYVRPVDSPLMTTQLIVCSGIGIINRRTGQHAIYHSFAWENRDLTKKFLWRVLDAWGQSFLNGAEVFIMHGTRRDDIAIPHASTLSELTQEYYSQRQLSLGKVLLIEGTNHPVLAGTMLLNGGQVFTLSTEVNAGHLYGNAVHNDAVSGLRPDQLAAPSQ